VRRETKILGREQGVACGKEGSVVHFEMDTTELSVEKAVERVLEFFNEVEVGR